MYANVGAKIKTVAKVICWLGIIVSVIGGMAMVIEGYQYSNTKILITGIVTILVGSLSSWIGSLFTYGYGQLIENSDSIKYNLSKKSD